MYINQYIFLSVCVSLYIYINLFFYLSIYLPINISTYLSNYLSSIFLSRQQYEEAKAKKDQIDQYRWVNRYLNPSSVIINPLDRYLNPSSVIINPLRYIYLNPPSVIINPLTIYLNLFQCNEKTLEGNLNPSGGIIITPLMEI